MGYKVAVVGATGAVGREMLQTLSERKFPADEVFALASEKSTGKEISYGEDGVIKVTSLDKFDFSSADIALFSAGGELSKAYAPRAGQEGCLVIDNSSAFRMDPNVPLIVPEVNPDTLKQAKPENKGKNIIANPNCSTAQLVVALKPIHDVFTIKQIAFNAIPHIDVFMDDGFTKEEWKMQVETAKILDPNIKLVAHCVRIPVFIGHSEAVFIETEKSFEEKQIRELLRNAEGLAVIDRACCCRKIFLI